MRSWTRRRTVGGLVLITAATVAAGVGCSKDKKVPSRPRVALVMKSLGNEFFLTMQTGAKQHQAARADQYELIATGTRDERDVDKQIQLVEKMIDEKVDAIVLAPADSKALVSVAKKALEVGIVVVNIDNKLDAGVLAEKNLSVPFVGPDNEKGARMAGEYLARRLAPGDSVGIIEGIPTAFNAAARKRGFEKAMSQAGIKVVVSKSGSWETGKAKQIAADMLRSHPNLKALLCANDSMAVGAADAIAGAGKTAEVLVVGFDNTSAAQELLRKGRLLATVDQHAEQLAIYGIEYALEIIRDKAIPADRETPVELVTRSGKTAVK